jgi:DNA alkylation repair enzyme
MELALLALLEPHKAGASPKRFFRYADAMLDAREFFIRKAIGWVLREEGKRRPDEVYQWLAPRAGRASGVTVREAVKYLEPAQRDAVLAGYRGSAAGEVESAAGEVESRRGRQGGGDRCGEGSGWR